MITIDGKEVTAQPGATILEAVRANGGDLPTLCNSPHLKPFGACRLCMVEADGKPVAGCHTPIQDGMTYVTKSDRLTRLRQNILELIVSDHPLDCDTCKAEGDCELQTAAEEVGLPQMRYTAPLTHDPPADTSHPFLHLDMTKCIGCGRCVRVCEEVQGSFVLGMAGRGYDMRIVAGDDQRLDDAGCRSCGQCSIECPTGAITDAVPPTGKPITTTCVYCAVGCSLNAYVDDGKVTGIRPNPNGSANRGHACVKGRFGHGFAQAEDRLKTPLIRQTDGSFREASWDEALDHAARRLSEIRDANSTQAFGMISSARCTNEENFLAQKFTRTVMGTNSVDNCARVCHSPSAFALGAALGTGAGTNSFEDVERSDVLMLVGANPTEAHPVFGARIKQAALKGAKLIVIDPRKTELARLADIHIPLRPGTNTAVINAIQQVLIEEDLIDRDFIAAHAENFEAVAEGVKNQTPEWAEPLSGVPAKTIRDAARLYASGKASQILWGLGITESCHGTVAAFGLINIGVMTGNLGREGTGTSPIRGQNNVQGACDMGALPNVYSDYRPVTDPAVRAEHEAAWGVSLPEHIGFKAPEMLEAARAGALKAMYIVAQDIAQSDPDTGGVIEALEQLEFLVVQDIFMSETAKYADVIFPGSSYLEKDGTFTNSDRRIQRVRKAIEPVAGYTDGQVIHELAKRMGTDLGDPAPSAIMDEISSLTPKWGGVSYERLEHDGFIQWPCPDADHPGTALVHANGDFLRGKARLTPTPWREPGEDTDEDFPFLLTTGRILFHYNVGTMTRRTLISELSQAKEERVRLNPLDANQLGMQDGQRVKVISRHGEVTAPIEMSDETQAGMIYMTFHFPETRTNLLIGPKADDHTQCPEYKVTAVRLEAE